LAAEDEVTLWQEGEALALPPLAERAIWRQLDGRPSTEQQALFGVVAEGHIRHLGVDCCAWSRQINVGGYAGCELSVELLDHRADPGGYRGRGRMGARPCAVLGARCTVGTLP